MATDAPLILFDGVCNVCNALVNFVIDRDPEARFRFAALQSDAASKTLAHYGIALPPGDPDSFVFVAGGHAYERSTAALHVAKSLGGAWRLFYAFIIVPTFARDAVYRLVARNRYRLFGKSSTCRVPTPELRARFLS